MEDRIKELEDEVLVLKEQVSRLEKIERRRNVTKYLKAFIKLIVIVVILFYLYKGYISIKTNYIDPYKEKIDTISESLDSIKDSKSLGWLFQE